MSNRPRNGDPLLGELDEARRRIFEKCGHDTEKVFDYYQDRQKQFADRVVSYESEPRKRPRHRRIA